MTLSCNNAPQRIKEILEVYFKKSKKKRIHICVRVEYKNRSSGSPFVTVILNGDPRYGFFYPVLTLMIYSDNLTPGKTLRTLLSVVQENNFNPMLKSHISGNTEHVEGSQLHQFESP